MAFTHKEPHKRGPVFDYHTAQRLVPADCIPLLKDLKEKSVATDPLSMVDQAAGPDTPREKLAAQSARPAEEIPEEHVPDEETFATVAGWEDKDMNPRAQCNHEADALRLTRTEEVLSGDVPACSHAVAAAIAEILHRPSEYGLVGPARRAIAHLELAKVVNADVFESETPTGRAEFKETTAAEPRYNVRVHNRFQVLEDLTDTIESFSDAEAAPVFSQQSRPPPDTPRT